MKRHQMRYYLRMREIEVLQYKHAASEDARALSSPRIDSSWSHAGRLYSGKDKDFSQPPKQIEGPQWSYWFAWVLPHVCVPHVVSVVVGLALLYLGIHGALGDNMRW